jgi:hypothetical protein
VKSSNLGKDGRASRASHVSGPMRLWTYSSHLRPASVPVFQKITSDTKPLPKAMLPTGPLLMMVNQKHSIA